MRGKTPKNFVKSNCIMQLADSVSVAKIKIIYASTQHAHSKPGAHSYDAAVHLTGDQWHCPFLELNQLHYPFAEQASQINGFVLKEKKMHILLDSVETNLNIWRVRWPSPRQVRVQVRDDRKTSRDRTRVLQPYLLDLKTVHRISWITICN